MKTILSRPLTRQDFFHRLDRHLTRDERFALASSTDETLLDHHYTLGQWIRNTWIYRGDGSLAAAFRDDADAPDAPLLITPDALSTRVLQEYRHYLQAKHHLTSAHRPKPTP